MKRVFLYLTLLSAFATSCCKITIMPEKQRVNLIALLNNKPIREDTNLGMYTQDDIPRNIPFELKEGVWIKENLFSQEDVRYIAYAPYSSDVIPFENGFTLPQTEDDIIYCPELIENNQSINYYIPFIHGKSRISITTHSNKDSIYVLKSVILNGAVKTATANLETTGNKVSINWTDKETPKDIELISDHPIYVTRKKKTITDHIFLIPGDRKSYLTVTFSAKKQPDEILNIPIERNLEENKIYKYDIYLQADEISFNPSVDDWIQKDTTIQ